MPINTSETLIKNQILDWLKYKNIFAWMVNNTGNFNKFTNSYYKNPRLLKGVADILILYEGRFVACECKSKTGRQTVHQIEFQKEVEANGGYYFIARSLEDVEDYFTNLCKA